MIDTGKLLGRALGGEKLAKGEIIHLLKIREKDELDALFNAARELRSRYFGDKVFIYGFLYISTYCRNNCRFCFYRSSSSETGTGPQPMKVGETIPARLKNLHKKTRFSSMSSTERSAPAAHDVTKRYSSKKKSSQENKISTHSSTGSLRYRKNEAEIIHSAQRLKESGVHLIDLTLGEDPYYFHQGERGFAELTRLAGAVKKATGLPLMVSPGVVPRQVLEELAGVGADWYACYQETHNPSLFKELRPGQSYEKRLNTKRLAQETGLLTEEGVLAGVGESPEDMAESIGIMASIQADQVRAMNFIPKQGTPMEHVVIDDPYREMVYTAVMRVVLPDRLIPASLDVAGLAGLKKRLLAGANVVTSLVPPGSGLAGVARSHLDIAENRRSVAAVLPVLKDCGLRAASHDDYLDWINKRKGGLPL